MFMRMFTITVISFVSFGFSFISGSTPARACGPLIEVNYLETDGDIMTIRNRSEQNWSLVTLTFLMGTSRGNVIFDTVYGGPGENAARDFYVVSGSGKLAAHPIVKDGGSVMLMAFSDFGPGREIDFSIDLDDQMPQSEMGRAYVTGQEIDGAKIEGLVRAPDGTDMNVRGTFNVKNVAHLTSPACV